jgi:hypothetical protein
MTAAEMTDVEFGEPYACDLCGLPVEVDDFELMTRTGPKRFCCEGCFGIFQMLNEEEILPQEDSLG